jgi:GGDEF domain-containing protein
MDTVHEVTPDADGARRQAAVSAVKRALRAAARGTDRVETVGDDRFRVVLAATGELAARAYLRRVRANVEPLLEELEPPRRLAVSTATILGEPVDQANEVAERRLQAAIEATHDAGIDRRSEPRVAAD